MEHCQEADCDILICQPGEYEEYLEDEEMEENPRRRAVPVRVVSKARKSVAEAVDDLYEYPLARVTRELKALPVTYNGRLSRAVGRCVLQVKGGRLAAFVGDAEVEPVAIEISSRYDLTPELLYHTIVHEFCHAAHALVDPVYDPWANSHGPTWRELMEAAGEEPSASCMHPEVMKQYSASIKKRRSAAQTRRAQRAARTEGIDREDLEIGDTVYFLGDGDRAAKGVVTKLNPKRAKVKQTSPGRHKGGTWGIPYQSLSWTKPKP
jgi:hypothetical protein